MKNDLYIVHLTIQTDGYEKTSTKLISATCEEDAENKSLLSECHQAIGEGAEWTDSGIADVGFEFHYSVRHCKKIEQDHIDIVRSYFTC